GLIATMTSFKKEKYWPPNTGETVRRWGDVRIVMILLWVFLGTGHPTTCFFTRGSSFPKGIRTGHLLPSMVPPTAAPIPRQGILSALSLLKTANRANGKYLPMGLRE